jgi:inner membrane protein
MAVEALPPDVYAPGHVGAALFCYAPVGAALSRGGEPTLALVGAAVAVACSTLPDADDYDVVPYDHRGPTHTVWFVAIGAAVAAGVGALAGLAVGRPVALAGTAGVAVFVSVGSHLLADVITPMGVRPFYPLSMWHHSVDLTPAKNPRVNTAFLGVGLAVAVAAQAAVYL